MTEVQDELGQTLYYLISGFQNWQNDSSVIPRDLSTGHRMLVKLLVQRGRIAPPDLPSLIKVCQEPTSEWKLPGIDKWFPPESSLLTKYIGISVDAEDFYTAYRSPGDAQQQEVRSILEYCRQADPPLREHYTAIRVYLSNPKHAVVTAEQLYGFISSLGDAELARLVGNCYEEVTGALQRYRPCPRCNWTMEYVNNRWMCNTEDLCGHVQRKGEPGTYDVFEPSQKVWRLKKGIHRYTLLPGMAETKLATTLRRIGYDIELYPEVDRYDIRLWMKHGVINIDVKDFTHPLRLAEFFNMLPEEILQKYHTENTYIIVPSYRNHLHPRYVSQVRSYLNDRKSVRIMDEKGLIKLLKEGRV